MKDCVLYSPKFKGFKKGSMWVKDVYKADKMTFETASNEQKEMLNRLEVVLLFKWW